MHFQNIAKEKLEWERIVGWCVKEQKIEPVEKANITYEFWFKDKKRRDPDNYAASAKMLQDGLVKAGILPDDNFNHVPELTIKQGGISKQPYILIHLTPA
jgi:Holliday junction resolvase RusA-like endonuclease